jgi:hypothetical protein
MDNLTIFLILVVVVLAYLIYTKHESLDNVSATKCVRFDMNDIQLNEVNYEEKDVESQYFNQLERNKLWNERQQWLNSMELEKKRQTVHECLLE